MERMTRLYVEKDLYQKKVVGYSYYTDYCLLANNTPCLVPQVKDILDNSTQKNLKICPTIWDYQCELNVLHQAGQMVTTECIKPCKTSQYKMTFDRETLRPRTYAQIMPGDTFISLWFSTNTIMQYKQVWVG